MFCGFIPIKVLTVAETPSFPDKVRNVRALFLILKLCNVRINAFRGFVFISLTSSS